MFAKSHQHGVSGHIGWLSMLSFAIIFASFSSSAQTSSGNTSATSLGTTSNAVTTTNDNSSILKLPPMGTGFGAIKYQLRFGIGGEEYQDDQQQMQEVTTRVYLKALYSPTSFADFNIYVGAIVNSGHSQFRYNQPDPTQGAVVREATVDLKPYTDGNFTSVISIGSIWLDNFIDLPILFYEDSFPGAREIIKYGNRRQYMKIYAGQMVPTSSSLSTQTTETETTPGFFIEGLEGKTPASKYFSLMGFGGHYTFSNLPSAVANNSGLSGNTIYDTGPNSSQFAYGFNGYFGGAAVDVFITPHLKFSVRDSILYNAAAPTGASMGQYLDAGFESHINPNLQIIPSAQYFFNESDTSPAFFNSGEIGHNNMQGYGGGLKVKFPVSNFAVALNYYEADLINPSPTQFHQQFIYLRFITDYGNAKLFD